MAATGFDPGADIFIFSKPGTTVCNLTFSRAPLQIQLDWADECNLTRQAGWHLTQRRLDIPWMNPHTSKGRLA